ncbi:methionyl-tRNA formyltransferase [Candidatus Daviesbacteria bacterium]|nr:methionyl-tRNA formyltransferase [Candidatus Daviesbacteria bacterium]
MNHKSSIVYFGTPQFSAFILEQLIKSHPGGGTDIKFNIKAVVTSPDKSTGRKQFITPSAVSKVAAAHGILVLKPEKLDAEFITTNHQLLTTDLFIVASYGKIIPQALLDIPKFGAINVHGSLLPKYRGASPIQAAILNGESQTGVTIMLMDEKMDHGPVLAIQKIAVNNDATFESLSNNMAKVGSELLIKTMPEFVNGKIKSRGQNHTIATFCTRIKKEDGYFDINNPPNPIVLDRMVRAYFPWPNAWTRFRQGSSGQAKIVKFLPYTSVIPAKAGIQKTKKKNGSSIKVEDDKTVLVQMEGKKPIPLKDFLNGYPDFPMKNI